MLREQGTELAGAPVTLETAYFISQIVAVILILASLIFVGIEIRQNTVQASQSNAIAKADLSERLLAKFNSVWAIVATDDAVSGAFEKILFQEDDLTRSERLRVLTWFSNLMNTHFNAFLLMQDGLIDRNMLRSFDNNTAWCLSRPIFETEWKRLLHTGLDFSPEFVAHVEQHRMAWSDSRGQSHPAQAEGDAVGGQATIIAPGEENT